MVEINAGHRQPRGILAVDRIGELRRWHHDRAAGMVWVGAGLPYSDLLSSPVADLVPALAQASRTVGSPQIRQAGTLGGNLGTCSPAGDTLPVLAALDAVVELRSVRGVRRVPFGEFMTGVKTSSRRSDELIYAIGLPVVHGWQGYAKVGVRNAMVIATASSCLVCDTDARAVRVALGSVGPVIIRCVEVENWVSAQVNWDTSMVSDGVVAEFAQRCAGAARPIDDHRSTAAYRRHAVEVLTRRQLRRAVPRG
jgi:CO/xanthine dehydrogenase FAD-binding subunit